MTNEALETHVIRWVDLLAVPRADGGRVFATNDGIFWQAEKITPPISARGDDGDCLELLTAFDGAERFSLTDSLDLGAKETIEIEFPHGNFRRPAIVIACRQSLVSTFLFYQCLAYLGKYAGDFIASIERMGKEKLKRDFLVPAAIGQIEVFVPDSAGQWISVGKINETGPIATDVHLLPLPSAADQPQYVRLRLSKGHWRIDQIALVDLVAPIAPIRLKPSQVARNGRLDHGIKDCLLDSAKTLTNMPGDTVVLVYELPEEFWRYELFLESRGYYLEWMREEWLAEENPLKAMMMLASPQEAFRTLAPAFKEIEGEMEEQFWSSRYAE